MSDAPIYALSIRQPWAWAILFAGKDIENRSWQAVNPRLTMRGRIAVHAAKGMTRAEYADAKEFMAEIGVACPAPAELVRGGVIGSVEVVDVVSESDSPWFFGPRGLVLRDPRADLWSPCQGALGYFRWAESSAAFDLPAKWMLPAEPRAPRSAAPSDQLSFIPQEQ